MEEFWRGLGKHGEERHLFMVGGRGCIGWDQTERGVKGSTFTNQHPEKFQGANFNSELA
jgi:hypothetical protein